MQAGTTLRLVRPSTLNPAPRYRRRFPTYTRIGHQTPPQRGGKITELQVFAQTFSVRTLLFHSAIHSIPSSVISPLHPHHSRSRKSPGGSRFWALATSPAKAHDHRQYVPGPLRHPSHRTREVDSACTGSTTRQAEQHIHTHRHRSGHMHTSTYGEQAGGLSPPREGARIATEIQFSTNLTDGGERRSRRILAFRPECNPPAHTMPASRTTPATANTSPRPPPCGRDSLTIQ